MAPLDRFLRDGADEIARRAALDRDRRMSLEAGAGRFSDAVDAATTRDHDRAQVPVTDCLDRLATGPLVAALLAARHELTWIPSPRTNDQGAERALAPLNDVRDLGTVTCGLMLLGPGCSYPEHAHPAHEIYLPISGAGRWQHGGDSSYRDLDDDTLVYNSPRALHAAQAGTDPLLALYVLWD